MVDKIDYLVKCLDPLHVGCGSFSIDKVDMPVLREIGTRLPVIPGSSLSGVLRSLMAYHENNNRKNEAEYCYPGAGSGPERRHCAKTTCPVCTVFGFADQKRGGSFHKGCAAITDATLVLFPVYSNRLGPVWVTSPSSMAALATAGLGFTTGDSEKKLLLGWSKYSAREVMLKDGILARADAANRVFQLTDRDYSGLVDHSLEVRTAVSIDAATGTARDKHLFNYEMVPRNAVYFFSVIMYPPRMDTPESTPGTTDLEEKITSAVDGLAWYGVGGMNTRGLGRLARVWPLREVASQ